DGRTGRRASCVDHPAARAGAVRLRRVSAGARPNRWTRRMTSVIRRPVAFIGGLVMSMTTIQAGAARESLLVGERLPVLKGQFLSGRDVELPRASSGKVALVAMGFTYKSRF